MATEIRYAGFPSALVFQTAAAKSKVLKQLLWGDWVEVTGTAQGSVVPVHARGCNGFMKTASLQSERLLELVFVDVGQGDGCLMIPPDDKMFVIDAGGGDNMLRFLQMALPPLQEAPRFRGCDSLALGPRSLRRLRRPVRGAEPLFPERLHQRLHGAENQQRHRHPRPARRRTTG